MAHWSSQRKKWRGLEKFSGFSHLREKLQPKKRFFTLVHTAAHGKKKTGEIALAPNPEWQSKTSIPMEEGYVLMMSDIQAIKLRVRLVVLRCCHSGKGEVSSEGGRNGTCFSFCCCSFCAVSLWAISDEATTVFMEGFY